MHRITLTSVSNRYMVNGFIGAEANGIYAVSYKIPTFLTLTSTVFMQAWQFSAVTESENDKQQHIDFFSKVWGSYQSIMFLVGSAVIAFSIPVIKVLTTKPFYSAWQYIPMLSLAMVFSAFANFMGSVYIVQKRSKNSFLTTMFGAVVNIILNLILIPSPLGVQGAAIATFVSYLLIFVVRAVDSFKYIPFKMYSKTVIINTLLLLVQTAFMVLKLPFNVAVQVVCILALCGINFKFIKIFLIKILSFVKGK